MQKGDENTETIDLDQITWHDVEQRSIQRLHLDKMQRAVIKQKSVKVKR